MTDILKSIGKLDGVKVRRAVRLADLTTWGVGGEVSFLVTVDTLSSLAEVLRESEARKIPLFVIGAGSNLLVADEGLDGALIRLSGQMSKIEASDTRVIAGGGASIGSMVTAAAEANLSGLEFAFGIPGTVGGAVIANAGAFESSIGEVISSAETITLAGKTKSYERFSDTYREPLVKRGEIVTKAVFELERESDVVIRKRMDEVRDLRRQTQPWGMRTAGSVFKNPPGQSAGKLIEESGFKGKKIGGARVSEIHANFIINEGGARASEIKSLIDMIRDKVLEDAGVELELEVRLLGFPERVGKAR